MKSLIKNLKKLKASSRGFTPSLENGIAPNKIGARKSAIPFFSAGFTYIELMMVIALFAILSGTVFFNFSDFTDNVSLQNLSQDIALEVKRAQSSSISGKNAIAFGSLKPSYGITIDLAKNNKEFTYFADYDNSGSYDLGEEIEKTTITKNNFIDSICVNEACDENASISITFKRPFLNATFMLADGSYAGGDINIIIASIRAGNKKTRSIKISSLGQISVK